MARILYGLCGEGMGHATRSEVVIKTLMKKHKIVIFSYDRAYEYLKKRFENKVLDVVDIVGFNFVYENNQFMVGKSIISERKKFNKIITENFPKYIKYVVKYNPFLIISDYEIVSGRLAKILDIPLISIDNMGFFTKGIVKKEFSKHWQVKFLRSVVSINGDYNFIISLFKIPLRTKFKSNTFFIGPFIRKEIIKAKQKEVNEAFNDKGPNELTQLMDSYHRGLDNLASIQNKLQIASIVSGTYKNPLQLLQARIAGIKANKDALLAGVKVTSVDNAGLDLMNSGKVDEWYESEAPIKGSVKRSFLPGNSSGIKSGVPNINPLKR